MNRKLDLKRIYIFLAITFGLAWIVALIIYLTGGLQNSPVLVSGTPITLAAVLLVSLVMWSPTLAHILTRWLTEPVPERLGWSFSFCYFHRPSIHRWVSFKN